MKHKCNKIVNFMFMLAMSVLLLQMFTPTAQAVTQVSTLDALKTALNNGGDIQLSADISTDATLTINSDTSLDLNGFGIRMSGDGSVIKMGGAITLILDSNPNTTHYITLNDTGRGTAVNSTQTGNAIEVKGGYITGGSGYIESDNKKYGGGIYVVGDQSTLNMSGGSIIGNTASNNGGGVYVGSTFTMSGGSIIRNTANDGGGVYLYGFYLIISGSPNITGNFAKGGVQQRVTFI